METLIVVIISIIIIALVSFTYPKMMLINIHEDVAKIEGINISLLNFLYLLSIALVVGLGVYLVGGLITAAIIATPAASSKNICKNLRSYKWVAIILGIINTLAGIFIAPIFHFPIGPTIIVFSAIIFLVTILITKIKIPNA